jgi:hypothetical protein
MADLYYWPTWITMAGMVALALALLVCAPPGAATPAAGQGRVLDRVVAVVRNPVNALPRPLTLTRLDEEARIALVSQGAQDAAFASLDTPARRALLRWVIDQWLVADEAVRLRVDDVPAEDLRWALSGFRLRFADEATYGRFLASIELTEEELASILARGLRVQRFLDSRLGRGAKVSEEEVTRRLAGEGVVAPTPAEREAARSRLLGERMEALVKQLLLELRARADVRVLAPELREEPGR